MAGRLTPAVPVNPAIDLPGIGITPTAAPAAPVNDNTTAPSWPETIAPVLQPVAPANPTTIPGTGLGTGPSATAAPGANVPPPARPVGDQDPLPYPTLPNGKGPLGQ